jgi:hypothetical protein
VVAVTLFKGDCVITPHFLSKLTEPRDIQRPVCFEADHQSFRGVRSGVVRKIKSIVTRVQRGAASNRIEREQERRASRLLLAAFGSIFHGHRGGETMRNVMNSDDRFGKMLVVARHIWLQDAWIQLQNKQEIDMEALMSKYIDTALQRLNTSVADGLAEGDSFDITRSLIQSFFDQDLRTNHLSLSSNPPPKEEANLIDTLKEIVRNETFSKVSVFGWKTVNRIRARCYAALETGSLQSIFCVRGIVLRLKQGITSLGERGKRREVRYTPVHESLEPHLLGVCRSTREFLSRQFDMVLAVAAQKGWL